LPYRIDQLLGSKKLAEMTRAAKALGRPEAGKEICRAVAKRVAGLASEGLNELIVK